MRIDLGVIFQTERDELKYLQYKKRVKRDNIFGIFVCFDSYNS